MSYFFYIYYFLILTIFFNRNIIFIKNWLNIFLHGFYRFLFNDIRFNWLRRLDFVLAFFIIGYKSFFLIYFSLIIYILNFRNNLLFILSLKWSFDPSSLILAWILLMRRIWFIYLLWLSWFFHLLRLDWIINLLRRSGFDNLGRINRFFS